MACTKSFEPARAFAWISSDALATIDVISAALRGSASTNCFFTASVASTNSLTRFTRNVGARPDAQGKIAIVTRPPDQRGNAEIRKPRAAVSRGAGDHRLISPSHQNIGHRLGQHLAAGYCQQMILALGLGVLHQDILAKPFAVLQHRAGNLDRGVGCEDTNDVGRRIGKPGNATSELRADGTLDIFE